MEEGTPAAPSRTGLWVAIVVVIIIVVVIAAAFGGLFGPLFPGPGPGPEPEVKQLRLATILDKTGGLAIFGPSNEQGARLAVEQIDAQGGVFGNPIVLFLENSNTDPATARDAATKVVTTNRVHGIIGSTGSGQCLTVLAIAVANDVFEMSGSCTSPIFADPTVNGGWFARTAPSDALQGVVAGNFAADNFTNVAVIGINNPYGTGLADVFETTFSGLDPANNITIKRIVTGVDEGATSYIADLDAVFRTSPEAIYLVAYPPDGILMLQEYNDGAYDPNVQWILSEGLLSQEGFVDELVARNIVALPTLLGTAPGNYVGVTGPRYQAFFDAFRARWAHNATLFDDNVYDATFMMALAAQASGNASGAGIQSKIRDIANPPGTVILPGEWSKAVTELAAGRDINYEGASGTTDLDANGDPVISQYAIWGINATSQITTLRVYDEAEVAGLLPAPPAPAPPQPAAPFEVPWQALFRED